MIPSDKKERKAKIRSARLSIHPMWRAYNLDGLLIDFWDKDERELPSEKRKGLNREELVAVLKERGYKV